MRLTWHVVESTDGRHVVARNAGLHAAYDLGDRCMRHKFLLEVVHGELESIIAVAHRPLEHRVDRRNAVLRVLERWPLGEDDAVAIGQRKVMGHAGRSHHGSAALMQGGGSGKQPGSRRGRASSCGSAAHGAAAPRRCRGELAARASA